MAARRNVRISYCHLLQLRACRAGYRNVRSALGESNVGVRSAYAEGDPTAEREWSKWQGRWLGRCSYWRARLRRSIRMVEDLLGRPNRV
jgi:hypothetical protein